MLVRDRMSYPVIAIHPKMPIQEALIRMRKEHVRRFPVIDEKGQLIGIVSERDLLHAVPSDASSLGVWEVKSLLSKLTVDLVMTKEVITVTGSAPLEEAARLLADYKIGGLPVIEGDRVVGIITETDLIKIFLEVFGARETGVRLTVLIPDNPGELAQLTQAVFEAGGNILALGTFSGDDEQTREVTIKVDGVEASILMDAVQPFILRILDVRGSPLTTTAYELAA